MFNSTNLQENTDPFSTVKKQGFLQKLAVSNMLTERADLFFGRSNFELAATVYTISLSIFGVASSIQNSEQEIYQELKYRVQCNLVSCFLGQKMFSQARAISEFLIKSYPNRPRPYKLRAQTILFNPDSQEKELATNDLCIAIGMDPRETDMNIKILKRPILKRLQFHEFKQKEQILRRMFRKKSDSNLQASQKKYLEDQIERPRSTGNKFKDHLDKIQKKTKKLWSKIINSFETELDLAYEIDEQGEIPIEVKKISEFIEKKLVLLKKKIFYKRGIIRALSPKDWEALKLKQKLEKLSRLDFSKPKKKIQAIALQFGIDLFNPEVQCELKKFHKEKLEKLKSWIKKLFSGDIALKMSDDDTLLYPLADQPELLQKFELYSNQIQEEIIANPQAGESIVREDINQPVASFSGETKLLYTSSYCGQVKVYVYNKCYGIAGLMGILVAIIIFGIYSRLM